MNLFSGLIVAFSVAGAWGAKVNERCSKNSHCELPNTFCKIITPSCGNGVCTCFPGFTPDNNSCFRAVFLDGECNPKFDRCVGENVECKPSLSNGPSLCTCKYGYKRGLKNNDCVPNLMEKVAGEQCHDTSQCYYSLVCINNKCSCYSGYKPIGSYHCISREVSDSCSSVEDCSEGANMICVNKRCACAHGYKAVTYMSNATLTHRTACIGQSENPVKEGQLCSFDKHRPAYCKPPYLCTFCGDRHVCALRILSTLPRNVF